MDLIYIGDGYRLLNPKGADYWICRDTTGLFYKAIGIFDDTAESTVI